MAKTFLFVVWVLLTLLVITAVTELITMSDTTLNVVGVIAATAYALISFKTKSFTGLVDFINKIKNKRNEK